MSLKYKSFIRFITLKNVKQSPQEVRKIFFLNDISATLVIPAEMARKHELHRGNHVVVEDTQAGILVRKLKTEAK